MSDRLDFDSPVPENQGEIRAEWDGLISGLTKSDVSDIILRDRNYQVLSNGELHIYPLPPSINGTFQQYLEDILSGRSKLSMNGAVEDTISIRKRRYRASLSENISGKEMVLRPLPVEINSPKDLLIDDGIIDRYCSAKSGMIIVGGSTGSGKSTTIASLTVERAKMRSERVITLEDPIEFVYPHFQRSSFSQKQLGVHFKSMGTGLKEALRMAPSMVIVQEIRDIETAEIAISASNTGHLVIATIHATDCTEVVQRFQGILQASRAESLDSSLDNLASALRLVVCQRLEKNEDTGKRVSVHEVMVPTPAVQTALKKRDYSSIPNLIEHGRANGMQTFYQSVKQRVAEGFLPGTVLREGIYKLAKG